MYTCSTPFNLIQIMYNNINWLRHAHIHAHTHTHTHIQADMQIIHFPLTVEKFHLKQSKRMLCTTGLPPVVSKFYRTASMFTWLWRLQHWAALVSCRGEGPSNAEAMGYRYVSKGSAEPYRYVILYLYYRLLCGITCLCCCKRKCFGVPLHVLKLMSLILVKLNCPVRDDLKTNWLD